MTPRAIIIGLLAVLLIGLATPYSDLVMRGTWIGLTAFPISAFFLLLVLVTIVNVLPRRLGVGLSTPELLVVYMMMLVAAGIPSFGLTGLLIPYMAGPLYFASPENKWEDNLLPHIPSWLHPLAGPVTTGLYEGLKPGAPIPWAAWAAPLALWTVLALSVYVVFFCLAAILRKRWVDDEKLVFPLIQLPVQMTRYEAPREVIPPFFRNGIMWFCFSIPFLVHGLNGLHFYFPTVPGINVHMIALDSYLTGKPWNALAPLWLRFLFSIIGLAYILPGELSFSLWFFYFFFLIQQVIGEAAGLPMPAVQAYPVRRFVAHQMIGGIVLYFVLGTTAAKPRLLEVWRAATGSGPRRTSIPACPSSQASRDACPTHPDSDEPLPYSLAFWGAVAGLCAICLWGSAAGAGFSYTLVLFVLYFALHIVAVRLVCEGGMLYIQHPFRPFNMVLAATGSHALGGNRLAVLGLFDHLWMLDNRSPIMPGIMQSLRLADEGNVPRRPLMGALAAAVLLAIVASYGSYLRLMYVQGGTKLNTWFTTYYARNLYGTWVSHLIADGEPATPSAFITIASGAATMFGIVFMHRTYAWWPLHPIGYLMGASWPMINFWFPIFLGWLIKTAVLHFGGPKVYQKLVPGFLGLVFAEFTAAGLWVLIDLCTGMRGHEIFSF
jgi:hypothetical protein